MKECNLPEQELHAWVDGEIAEEGRALAIADHVEDCDRCEARVDTWQKAGDQLREIIDDGVGEVEPLLALQQIRLRINERERRSPIYRIKQWWGDLWAYNRRSVAGLAMALALGIISAPAVMWWAESGGEFGPGDPELASVVVESLEYDGNAIASVLRSKDGTTTLIWVEPSGPY